jgi:hypothetical protein
MNTVAANQVPCPVMICNRVSLSGALRQLQIQVRVAELRIQATSATEDLGSLAKGEQ